MRKITEKYKMEGLEIVNPKYPKIRYMASKKFVMVEFDVADGEEYVSVYLRPYDQTKTLITAYLPELRYFSDLRIFNKSGLVKFLSRSQKLSDLYTSASTISDKPFLSEVQDFTETRYTQKLWCIQKIVNLKLTPKIINEDFPEYQVLENGINDIIAVIVEFLRVYKEHLMDFDLCYWKNRIDTSQLELVIEKKAFCGSLFNTVNGIKDKNLRECIKECKIAILCKNGFYTIGEMIDEKDKTYDAKVIILAEILAPSLKNSNYIFVVDLEYKYGSWRAKANVGELINLVSIMMNHISIQKSAKIEKYVYKNMPISTELWYYSNPHHAGTMLHLYVKDGDTTHYDVPTPAFRVEEPYYITNKSTIDCDVLWSDVHSFYQVIDVIKISLTIIYEYINCSPKFLKTQMIVGAAKVGRFLVNPFKYSLKKFFKID